MQLALDLAAKASQQGDVPVGAIVLNSQGDIVGRGFNTREVNNDPMNHAEIVAMREAAIALDFEAAARLRDQLFEVRTALGEKPEQARGNTAAPKRPPGSAPMRRAGGKRGR
mgnify:FL=1